MSDHTDPKILALALTSTEKLHKEFDGIFSPETVRLCLEESATALSVRTSAITSLFSRTVSPASASLL